MKILGILFPRSNARKLSEYVESYNKTVERYIVEEYGESELVRAWADALSIHEKAPSEQVDE